MLARDTSSDFLSRRICGIKGERLPDLLPGNRNPLPGNVEIVDQNCCVVADKGGHSFHRVRVGCQFARGTDVVVLQRSVRGHAIGQYNSMVEPVVGLLKIGGNASSCSV